MCVWRDRGPHARGEGCEVGRKKEEGSQGQFRCQEEEEEEALPLLEEERRPFDLTRVRGGTALMGAEMEATVAHSDAAEAKKSQRPFYTTILKCPSLSSSEDEEKRRPKSGPSMISLLSSAHYTSTVEYGYLHHFGHSKFDAKIRLMQICTYLQILFVYIVDS